MSETELKNRIGIFLVLAQFGTLVMIIFLYFAGGFLFDEMTTTAALVLPMLASYTTVITKHFTRTRRQVSEKTRPVTNAFVFVSFLIPLLFVFLIVTIIVLKSLSIGFSSFDQFKTMLAIVESAFAIYLGQIIYSLFGTK